MRRAGALAAATLDFITPYVRPGVTTGELDRLCHGFIVDHGAIPAPLNYRGFPKSICTSVNHVVCHGIPGDRRLMRRRHSQYRRDSDPRRLARRYEPDVLCRRQDRRQGAQAGRCHLRGDDARHRGGASGRARRRDRRRDPALCRGQPVFGRARFLRPRGRARVSRRAVDPALRQARRGAGAARGHVLYRRADDQCRPLRGEGAERRLDRGDQGPLAVGAVRAHDRSDRDRVRDFYDLRRPGCTGRPTISAFWRTARAIRSRASAASAASAQRAGSSSCNRWLVPGIAR